MINFNFKVLINFKWVCLCGLFTTSLAFAKLPAQVNTALAQANINPNHISISIHQLTSGFNGQYSQQKPPQNKPNLLLTHNGSQPRVPASTLKLLTTYAALDTLGANFKWQTPVLYTGDIANGTLTGDLIIQGSGDPKLVRERIETLWQQVQQAGIRQINGNLIIDDHIFTGITHDPASFDGKPLCPYNVAPNGLLVNFAAVTYHFVPMLQADGYTVIQLTSEPALANLSLPTQVKPAKGSCGYWQRKLKANFTAAASQFAGAYPSSCGEQSWSVAYPVPEQFAGQVLLGTWQQLGGSLTGKVLYQHTPVQAKVLFTFPSLPLAQLIHDINHFSNNVMTEQVLLSLPIYAQGQRRTANSLTVRSHSTYPTALAWLGAWWQKNLPNSPEPKLTNGSGLCRDCTIRADSLDALLQHAYASSNYAVFKNSLGIAGVSGTIKTFANRQPNSPAIGHAYIKTGTLDNVTSMAGYVYGQSGAVYSIVAIINANNAPQGRVALDALLDWLARQ